jgi:integral membrane sensor domain MASE1
VGCTCIAYVCHNDDTDVLQNIIMLCIRQKERWSSRVDVEYSLRRRAGDELEVFVSGAGLVGRFVTALRDAYICEIYAWYLSSSAGFWVWLPLATHSLTHHRLDSLSSHLDLYSKTLYPSLLSLSVTLPPVLNIYHAIQT